MLTNLSVTHSVATGAQPVVITLFGAFNVSIDDRSVDSFRSSKARALLAYLLVTRPQPLLRTTLVDLLWPGYATESAQASLRQTIANVRASLKPFDLLHADRRHVRLTLDPATVWCDALHFAELLDVCQHHAHQALTRCPACQERLRQALALYKGPFLDTLPTVDSAPFTAWLQAQRTHFADRVAALQTMLTAATMPPGNLPRPLTPLIGRSAELSELADKLLHPVYRCLTLIGPGGIGKTRLAIALGERLRANFVHGSWFAPLAAVPVESQELDAQTHLNDRLATAISTALGLTLHGASHPTEQVVDYLRDKTLLLILDNFEHLTAGVDWLVALLLEAPHVRLLVTSRHRLPLQAQLVYRVGGLSLPPETVEETLLSAQFIARYASLQLFVERAENALFPFQRDRPNLAAISALCRLLEGAPLGIELAVALLETQTPSEILHAVRAHYAALQANLSDLPQRHRSSYAVLHTTWGLLNAQETQTLARCSVFRGSFTLTAAQQIIDATTTDLESLVDKSLLHRDESAHSADEGGVRYKLHELVRQFAAEQLVHKEPVLDRHASYYLAVLEGWRPGAKAERIFHQTVQLELANVEAAWDWALAGDLATRLPGAVNGLAEFYELSNAYHAAEAILQHSVAQVRTRLASPPATSPHHTRLRQFLAALLGRLAYVYANNLGQPERAIPVAEEGLALALTLDDAALTTYSYFALQAATYGMYDFVRGRALGEKALALAQQHGLVRERALVLVGVGLHAAPLGDYAASLNALTQALELTQQIDDTRLEQIVRNCLGVTYRMMGDFAQAFHCFEQNLPLLRQADAPLQVAGVMANLGFLRLILGDYPLAVASIEEGYQLFTALGEKRMAAECLAALGWLCVQQGENASAIAYGRQALALALNDGTQQAIGLTVGDAYLNLGELDAAQSAYTQVVNLSQRGGSAAERWHAQAGLAAVSLAQGDKAAALAAVDALLIEFDPAQPDGWQCPQRLLLTCYRVLTANHDPRATTVLHHAWALVQSQAENISDPDLRTSFFTNVPVNRALGLLIAS